MEFMIWPLPLSHFLYYLTRNFLSLSRSKFLIDDKRRSLGSKLVVEHERLEFKSRLTGLRAGLRKFGGTGKIGAKEFSLFLCLFANESIF